MSKPGEPKSIFSRFRLLTWLGAFFCFFLVPLLLTNEGLSSMLRIRCATEQEKIFSQMDNHLNFLIQHADEPRYFHQLMKNAFNKAILSNAPQQSIEKSIKWFKNRFPGSCKFIVWNDRGRVIERLTDEKSYKYIVNNLRIFFSIIAEHCRENPPGSPEILPIVEKRINLFRSYLGRFLVPSHLAFPFRVGEYGRCIMANTSDNFPLFWFDSRDELTVLCFIRPPRQYNAGVKHAIEILNRENSPITTGFIDLRRLSKDLPGFSNDEQRLLIIELGKFENAALPHRNTASHLISFKFLTPDLRGFCITDKQQLKIGYPDQVRIKTFSKIGAALIVLLFIAYCRSLRLPATAFSIRTRIAFLFIYANGLPLMILGTIGYEYLQQRGHSLTQETHRQNSRIIQEVDAGYQLYLKNLALKARQQTAGFKNKFLERLPDKTDADELQKILSNLNANEIYVFDAGGETLISCRNNHRATSQTFMRMYAASTIDFANQNETFDALRKSEKTETHLAKTSTLIVSQVGVLQTHLLSRLERIDTYTFGIENKMCFAALLGNRKARKFHSLMMISWRKEDTQAAYAREQIQRFDRNSEGIFLAGMAKHNGAILCKNDFENKSLRKTLQKAINLQYAHENFVTSDGKNYLLTAIAGRQMENIALAAVMPADFINLDIQAARNRILLLVFVSMLIIGGIITALSRHFIGPLRELAEAVRQIGRQNFAHRVSIDSGDEFDELGKVFNTTIEGMAELAIGKIVQEALLPPENYTANNLRIFARTATMTKLGGDYFDFFKLPGNKTGIFMGDVAGHGIPAALIMAMAKSTVTINSKTLLEPAQMITALHGMLYRLKHGNFKRMMTCQYALIDDISGECIISNAGHCFPIIVSADARESRFEEMISTPVGIARKAIYDNRKLSLRPGETMILYSDGMIEATNSAGAPYGVKRLLELAQDGWHYDLQQYYQNLFQANHAWAAKAEDDITIVLVRLVPEVENA